MKHTKGEWKAIRNEGTSNQFNIVANQKTFGSDKNPTVAVCKKYLVGISLDETEANAKLISKSPEMYEALKRINEMFDDDRSPMTISDVQILIDHLLNQIEA